MFTLFGEEILEFGLLKFFLASSGGRGLVYVFSSKGNNHHRNEIQHFQHDMTTSPNYVTGNTNIESYLWSKVNLKETVKNNINKWRKIVTKHKSCFKVADHMYWNLNSWQNDSEKSTSDGESWKRNLLSK